MKIKRSLQFTDVESVGAEGSPVVAHCDKTSYHVSVQGRLLERAKKSLKIMVFFLCYRM